MASRNGYRVGLAQVQVWLDPDVRDRLKRKADRHGRSMQAEVTAAVMSWLGEEVDDRGERGDGPGRGRAAVADQRGPRPVPRGHGPAAPRVGAGHVGDAVDIFGSTLAGAEEPVLFSVPDPIDEIA